MSISPTPRQNTPRQHCLSAHRTQTDNFPVRELFVCLGSFRESNTPTTFVSKHHDHHRTPAMRRTKQQRTAEPWPPVALMLPATVEGIEAGRPEPRELFPAVPDDLREARLARLCGRAATGGG